MDDTSKWLDSFGLVPKANGKVRLCLDSPRLDKALLIPVLRGLMLNDILPRLAGVKCFTLRDFSSGYH